MVMAYQSILVNLDMDGINDPVLNFAADLASRLEARLIGFAAAAIAPQIVSADGMVFDGEIIQMEREEIGKRLKELEQQFTKQASAAVSCEWRGGPGEPTLLLSEFARAADLIITATPEEPSLFNPYRSVDLGSLVLRAGRPVLLAKQNSERLVAQTALVAWKDSREARRAVSDAVPLLAMAGEVVVTTLSKEADIQMKESLSDVAAYLSRHGIAAQTEILKQSDEPGILVEFARSIRADLVVAGGYGHSRLREWVFGGMTRSLFKENRLNRFMSN
jgi:nucleotide-binding universal stress UspA family protein